jgi:hypothetical protein
VLCVWGGGATGSTRQGARIDRRWWSTKSTRETDGPTSPVPNARSRPGAAARRAGAVGGSREHGTPTARQRRTGTRDTAAGGDSNYGSSIGGSREQDAPTARRRSANPGTRGAKNVKAGSGGHDGGVTLCAIAETTERPVRPGGGGDAPPRERACQEKDSRRHGTRGEDGGPDWGTRREGDPRRHPRESTEASDPGPWERPRTIGPSLEEGHRHHGARGGDFHRGDEGSVRASDIRVQSVHAEPSSRAPGSSRANNPTGPRGHDVGAHPRAETPSSRSKERTDCDGDARMPYEIKGKRPRAPRLPG